MGGKSPAAFHRDVTVKKEGVQLEWSGRRADEFPYKVCSFKIIAQKKEGNKTKKERKTNKKIKVESVVKTSFYTAIMTDTFQNYSDNN